MRVHRESPRTADAVRRGALRLARRPPRDFRLRAASAVDSRICGASTARTARAGQPGLRRCSSLRWRLRFVVRSWPSVRRGSCRRTCGRAVPIEDRTGDSQNLGGFGQVVDGRNHTVASPWSGQHGGLTWCGWASAAVALRWISESDRQREAVVIPHFMAGAVPCCAQPQTVHRSRET
jgi:hypothetical protein